VAPDVVHPSVMDPITGETDPFYIRTPTSLADDRHLVLKQGETFIVLDRRGDIRPVGLAQDGLYFRGTRFLSRLALRLGPHAPLLLSSSVKHDNALVAVDLTNPDIGSDTITIPRGTLHLSRTIALWEGMLHERLRIRNFSAVAIAATIALAFDADYADIFEVRGSERSRRGDLLVPDVDEASVVLAYRGLDGVTRRTRLRVDPPAHTMSARQITIDLALEPHEEATYDISFACEIDDAHPAPLGFAAALSASAGALSARRAACCEITTSNTQFNEWLARSLADLSMMTIDSEYGLFPHAGVPWFSTPFGRDSIITALEVLWAAPAFARGVLGYLAASQATAIDDERDAQPGKIVHEARDGEMAALREIPFGLYYGSHDATPLFVVLAAEYYVRTGDRECIDRIWPNILAALDWIERYGDLDGDGFVEYQRLSPNGLVQQGWKDSHDSVFHEDGRLADGPIALCEIQGYVYAAWRGASRLARLMGQSAEAEALASKAAALRARFDDAFWLGDLGTYALALDGAKQPCRIVASNAGHALYCGLASHSRAAEVARTLMSSASYSGWGIRTVSTAAARYNPMSYHNGSIWPHDNAMIAGGFARYDLGEHALTVLDGLFDASVSVDVHRLPELFCGFARRDGEHPTLYPVACSPQAWASGSAFLMLQAVLGLEINAPQRLVRFTRSRLPAYLEEVRIRNLRIGPVEVDLALDRQEYDVSINVLRRAGHIEIVAIK
jgi:glycogen debranching enzyme